MTQQLNDSTADLKKKQLEFFTHKIKTLCNIKPQLALNAASDMLHSNGSIVVHRRQSTSGN